MRGDFLLGIFCPVWIRRITNPDRIESGSETLLPSVADPWIRVPYLWRCAYYQHLCEAKRKVQSQHIEGYRYRGFSTGVKILRLCLIFVT
jgi:hypothetical protein